MNIMERLMNHMMNSMSEDQKNKMMSSIMKNSNKGSEDKMNNMEEMMQSMMAGMNKDGVDKQEFNNDVGMSNMMEMMSKNMGNGDMKEMMKHMQKNMPMMGHKKCGNMGNSHSQMEMCQKMMASFANTSELAAYATPELRLMFDEWLEEVQQEIINIVEEKKITSPKQIASNLKLSEKSVSFLLGKLGQENKLNLEAKSNSEPKPTSEV